MKIEHPFASVFVSVFISHTIVFGRLASENIFVACNFHVIIISEIFMQKKITRSIGVFALFFTTIATFSQNVITVTDCNLNGWVKQPIGNSTIGFVDGPVKPPLGKGSLKFYVPPGIVWPGDFVRLRNGQYSGTPLSSLTELSYETYIEARDTIADVHFIVVLSDINGDGSAEHNLVFDPRYQNPSFIRGTMRDQGNTQENVWQKWNALQGGWFFGGDASTDPDHGGTFFTLAEYMSIYPNATIRNDAAKGGPAIRLTAGGVVFKPNFFGSIDNFKIGINGVTTSYDFEFTTADAGNDKNVVYGYGSNCTTLNGTAAGGIAPYTYLWSPGGRTPNGISTVVCPTVTTTYTLTVTDKNGCTRTDDVTVFVNDVHCGNKMDKVKLCHHGAEICIAPEAVPAHLNHGDVVGSCASLLRRKTDNQLEITTDKQFKLSNYPNPFSSTTRISYELPFEGRASIKIYDFIGREIATVANENKKPGIYNVDFESRNISAGVYYYKIIASSATQVLSQTKKMIIIR
jgi:hypothetical protein